MFRTQKHKRDLSYFRKAGMLLLIPILWGVCPVVGYFIGYLLDLLFHTETLLRLIFLFLGIGAAIRETYIITRRFARGISEE